MKVDWSRAHPAEELREPPSEEVQRAMVASRLRAVHRPNGVSLQGLVDAMDGLAVEDGDVFADAVAEEDRGLDHFAGPLRQIAGDPDAPKPFRALSMAALGALEDSRSLNVLSDALADPDLSRFAAGTMLGLRSVEAVRALVGALSRTEGWAKADVLLALLQVGATDLEEIILVESARGLGPAQGAIAFPIAASIGLERGLMGDLGEAGRAAAVELFGTLLEEEASGQVALSRPLLMVGELVECMLDGLSGRAAGFRELRVATMVMASGEVPSLEEELHRLVEGIDVPSEVRAALSAGKPTVAVTLTRTFRSTAAATVLFDELVMNEAAPSDVRALALRASAELDEPRASGVVRAALSHANDLLRAAALDAARHLVPALGREALAAHGRAGDAKAAALPGGHRAGARGRRSGARQGPRRRARRVRRRRRRLAGRPGRGAGARALSSDAPELSAPATLGPCSAFLG